MFSLNHMYNNTDGKQPSSNQFNAAGRYTYIRVLIDFLKNLRNVIKYLFNQHTLFPDLSPE